MATAALQIAQVDMLIADNESLLFSFALGDPADTSWGLEHKTLYADFKTDADPNVPANFKTSSADGDNTILILDTVQRIIQWNVPRDTIHTDAGVNAFVYDLLIVDDTQGTVQRIFRGTLTIEQGVTRDNAGTSP